MNRLIPKHKNGATLIRKALFGMSAKERAARKARKQAEEDSMNATMTGLYGENWRSLNNGTLEQQYKKGNNYQLFQNQLQQKILNDTQNDYNDYTDAQRSKDYLKSIDDRINSIMPKEDTYIDDNFDQVSIFDPNRLESEYTNDELNNMYTTSIIDNGNRIQAQREAEAAARRRRQTPVTPVTPADDIEPTPADDTKPKQKRNPFGQSTFDDRPIDNTAAPASPVKTPTQNKPWYEESLSEAFSKVGPAFEEFGNNVSGAFSRLFGWDRLKSTKNPNAGSFGDRMFKHLRTSNGGPRNGYSTRRSARR